MSNPIVKPLITEKTIAFAKDSKYTFIVNIKSDKKSIANAVEKAFGVKVVSVLITLIKGRTKRVGKKRNEININAIKKAVVKLAEGQKIDLFELSG